MKQRFETDIRLMNEQAFQRESHAASAVLGICIPHSVDATGGVIDYNDEINEHSDGRSDNRACDSLPPILFIRWRLRPYNYCRSAVNTADTLTVESSEKYATAR